ncbi:hypothetical protein BpHYR1_021850 [Brachionus plicatilis]|uniref:Uncharacterized protein n=1 Tax=Brachionus plicatilis TaxID=10195 RepID=A0A3M7T4J0_BRAPC|nr:hypothetical protein BpHYR1_021850 [Brachionus plicatilis]
MSLKLSKSFGWLKITIKDRNTPYVYFSIVEWLKNDSRNSSLYIEENLKLQLKHKKLKIRCCIIIIIIIITAEGEI